MYGLSLCFRGFLSEIVQLNMFQFFLVLLECKEAFDICFQRDQESLKDLFQRAFLEHIYPLCHSASIQPAKFGDRENEKVCLQCHVCFTWGFS